MHMHKLDNTKKAIPDFITWAQCFVVYSAALLQKHAERAADLMAYFFGIANNIDGLHGSFMIKTFANGYTLWAKTIPASSQNALYTPEVARQLV